jgi:hypothetical protein
MARVEALELPHPYKIKNLYTIEQQSNIQEFQLLENASPKN